MIAMEWEIQTKRQKITNGGKTYMYVFLYRKKRKMRQSEIGIQTDTHRDHSVNQKQRKYERCFLMKHESP